MNKDGYRKWCHRGTVQPIMKTGFALLLSDSFLAIKSRAATDSCSKGDSDVRFPGWFTAVANGALRWVGCRVILQVFWGVCTSVCAAFYRALSKGLSPPII